MSLTKEAYIRYKIIDECLTNKFHPYPTVEEIIQACEERLGKTFTISCLQKDIRAMKEDEAMGYHAPIRFSRQHMGYYYSDPEYSINSIPLNSDELQSLEAMADVLSTFSGSRISENYNQAIQKIFAALKEKTTQQGGRRRIIQTDSQINHKGFEYFEKILHAIINKIPVGFIHYSYKKRRFNSIIAHPVLLKEFQNNWYVLAYSEQHRQLRVFGLDRIHDPLFLKTKFHPIDADTVNHYFDNIYGTYPLLGEKLQKITFLVDPLLSDYLKANPIHASQKAVFVASHGMVKFELELVLSQELVNFFIQHSPDIFILKPQNLIKRVSESITRAGIHYNLKKHVRKTI